MATRMQASQKYLAEFKSGAERKDDAVRTINAYNAAQAYMFKYDSTHGPFKGSIKVVDVSTLEIMGSKSSYKQQVGLLPSWHGQSSIVSIWMIHFLQI